MKRTALVVCLLAMLISSPAFAQQESEGNGKDFGVAINPVFALFSWFSGEVNIWKLDRTGEINIPVAYAHDPFFIDEGDYSLDIFTVGTNYRKFFNTKQEGFYLQGGYYFAHASVEGKDSASGKSVSSNQNAVLFGLGYRMISQTNGLFWSFGFAAGRRWGEIKDTDGSSIQNDGAAFSVDLLKVGYSW